MLPLKVLSVRYFGALEKSKLFPPVCAFICERYASAGAPSNLGSKQFDVRSPDVAKKLEDLSSDPDKFGTLSRGKHMRRMVDQLPDEEGDVTVKNYIDEVRRKTKLTPVKYAKLIKSLLQENKVVEALDVLDVRMLKEDHAKPDEYIYRILISGCAKRGYTKKAFQLFNQMKKRGLKATGGIYTSLFNACSNSPWNNDGFLRAQALRELMLEKGYIPNQKNYHAMIKAFGRCGDIKTAFSLVDEMSQNNVVLTTETFNFLLQACISHKDSGFKYALLVWKKMREKYTKPDIYTFNLILRCTAECGVGDQEEFNREMLRSSTPPARVEIAAPNVPGIVSSSESCQNKLTERLSQPEPALPNLMVQLPPPVLIETNGIISTPQQRFSLLGSFDGFLNQMVKHKVKPDVKTFTQCLEVIPSSKNDEEALLSAMKMFGVKLDTQFCNVLLRKRCLSHRYSEASDILNLIRKESLVPDIVTFGVLALCCQSSEEVHNFIKDIQSAGFRLNIELLGALVYTACRAWNLPLILNLLEKRKEEQLQPNQKFVNHLQDFERNVLKDLQSRDSGKSFNKKMNKTNFNELFEAFQKELRILESLPLVGADVHPWDQFKQKKVKSG